MLPLFSQLDEPAPQVSPRRVGNPLMMSTGYFYGRLDQESLWMPAKTDASSWKLILVAIREFFQIKS